MERSFFYVDGMPNKGAWVALDSVNGWADVIQTLHDAGFQNPDEILCADAEGLARCFLTRYDCFDLAGYIECRDSCDWASNDAKAAYVDCFGSWDSSGFEDSYSGEWDNDTALTNDFIESTGMLDSMPDNLRGYFNTEAFTRDLMMDYSESGGYYFRNC